MYNFSNKYLVPTAKNPIKRPGLIKYPNLNGFKFFFVFIVRDSSVDISIFDKAKYIKLPVNPATGILIH